MYDCPACDGGTVKPVVFVSYSRESVRAHPPYKACLEQIERRLAPDWRVFRDTREVDPNAAWREEIADALRDCDAAVVLLSPPALNSKWVYRECILLEQRRRTSADFPIAAIGFEGVTSATVSGDDILLDGTDLARYSTFEAFRDGIGADHIVSWTQRVLGDVSRFTLSNPELSWLDAVARELGECGDDFIGILAPDLKKSWFYDRRTAPRVFARRLLGGPPEDLPPGLALHIGARFRGDADALHTLAQHLGHLWVHTDHIRDLRAMGPGGLAILRLDACRAAEDHAGRTWLIEPYLGVASFELRTLDSKSAVVEVTLGLARSLGRKRAIGRALRRRASPHASGWEEELRREAGVGEVTTVARDRIREAIAKRASAASIAAPVTLILGRGFLKSPAAVEEIRGAFADLLIVLLARDTDAIQEWSARGATLLGEEMTPEAERRGLEWRDELFDELTSGLPDDDGF